LANSAADNSRKGVVGSMGINIPNIPNPKLTNDNTINSFFFIDIVKAKR
jgi:hypothetical protein